MNRAVLAMVVLMAAIAAGAAHSLALKGDGTVWTRFETGDFGGSDGFDDLLTSSALHPVDSREGETFVFLGKAGP